MIDETVRDIREMRTHSSSAVARKAARALQSVSGTDVQSVEEFNHVVERNSRVLRQANHSHAWLQSSQRELVRTVHETDAASVPEAETVLENACADMIRRIDRATGAAAKTAFGELNDGDRILTHDFSSTVLATANWASQSGYELSFVTTESRPRYMGRRMARMLAEIDGIDVTLIVDSAAGQALDRCDRVLTGMDCLVGDVIYNRVGTLPIATVARNKSVPMTVTGAADKIVGEQFQFTHDERGAVEVMREPTPEFLISNPAYDATPVDLIEHVATDDGLYYP